MDSALSPLDLATRLGVAVFLGGVLGFERECRSKPAGLRTHMMVALGAACFTLTAFGLVREVASGLPVDTTAVDPTRVVQGIIGGIGFLGAGAIIRTQGNVEGLTTAGSIWLSGAVGISAGAGNFLLAGLSVVLAVGVLLVLGWLQHQVKERPDDAS